jgi:carboxylate-amine ligase
MQNLGIVASMKDFYWDIRPKPEYGTVEIRICDTPLSIDTPVLLAAYAQMLARHCFSEPPEGPVNPEHHLTYSYNRFQACRFGYDAVLVDAAEGRQTSLLEDLLFTLDTLVLDAQALGCQTEHNALRERALKRNSDSQWLRNVYQESNSLPEVVRRASERWMYGQPGQF